jgi:PAS domain S-box-containing protein
MPNNNPNHSRFFWRSSAMFAFLDNEGRFKEVNAAWDKMLGLTTSQLLAKSLIDFIHPDDRLAVNYYFDQLRQGSVSIDFSSRFRHNNGSYHQLLWEVTAAASQEDAFYVVAMDYTEHSQPSIADEIVSVLDEGIVLQYANGTIGACNRSAERILGLTAEQMIGWTLIDPDWNAIREDGSPFPTEAHPAICTLRTGKPYTNSIMGVEKSDGSLIWLRINAYPLWRDEMTPYAVVISFADITQYKETEIALKSHHGTPILVNDNTNDDKNEYDFWDWNLESNSISFPPQWKQMLGYRTEELLNHIDTWYRRIHPLDYKRVTADIQSHLEGATPHFENVHRLQHRDGSYRWVKCRGTAVRDNNGKPAHLIGMHIDITEQQQAEDKRLACDTKYQQLLDTETSAVFLVETDSDRIVEINRSAVQIYGYSRQELLNLKRSDLSAQAEKSQLKQQRTGKYTRRRHHKRKDNSVFPVEMTVNPFALHGHDMQLIIVTDISERSQVETALWESQTKYRQLFEAASSAIVIFDANTQQIFDVNNTAMDMYGYTKEEWMHLTTMDMSAEPVKSRSMLAPAKHRQIIPLRWHKKKDGTQIPVEITTGSSYLFQGRSLVCAMIRDMSERKAAEEALRAERDFVNTLVQASPAFFLAINPNGTIRMVNKALLETTGFSTEELEGKNFIQALVFEADQESLNTQWKQLTQVMRPSTLVYRIKTKNNTFRSVEWHSRAIVQPDGVLDYVFGVGIDLTERDKTLADLQLFKTIIEASDEAITISDANGKLIYTNPMYSQLFKYPLETLHLNPRSPYLPVSCEIIDREIQPALQKGKSWTGELEVANAEGHHFPVWQRADAVRDEKGNILFKFELMHDISDRKRLWEKLRNQWEESQLLFDTLPLYLWHWDKNQRLIYSNRRATENIVFDENMPLFSPNRRVLELGEPRFEMQSILLKKQNVEHNLHIGRVPSRNDDDQIDGLIMFALDLTECRPQGVLLNDSDDKVRRILEQLPFILNVVDENGHLLVWNKFTEQSTGYTAREVLSNPDIVHKIYPNTTQLARLSSREGERNWEGQLVCKDGSQKTIRWFNAASQYPISSWYTWQIGQIIESTSIQGEKTNHDMINFIFENTHIGICFIDDRGRFVKMNRAYADLYGYQVIELIDKPFTTILPQKRHDEAIRDYFAQLVSNEEPRLIRNTLEQRRDGSKFSASALAQRIILADGRRLLASFWIRTPEEKL